MEKLLPVSLTNTSTITIEAGPNQKLEFELSLGSGQRDLVIRELTWGQGVGWFAQKSISMDSAQIDALLKALCCLRTPELQRSICALAAAREHAESKAGRDPKIIQIPQSRWQP